MKAEKYGRNIIGLQRNGDCMIDILEDCTADRCFNALGKAPDEQCRLRMGGENANMVYIKTQSYVPNDWIPRGCFKEG